MVSKRKKLTARLKSAIQKSEEFFGFVPRKLKRKRIEWSGTFVDLGACARVDYVNDKWDGQTRIYYHNFEKPARLLVDPEPQPDGSMVMVIVGKFKIEADGIIG